MLEQDRILSIVELLNLLKDRNKIASKLLTNYFRSKKYIGSKDRSFISISFWNILRHRYKINWHLDYLNLEVTLEKEMMLELFFLNKDYCNNVSKIKKLFILKYKDIKIFNDADLDFLNRLNFNEFYNNEMPEHIFYELPKFLLKSLKKAFKKKWREVALSLNEEGFFDIRINTLKGKSRDQIFNLLKDIKVPFQNTKYSPLGIRLSKRFPIQGHKLFKKGYIEIQGEASQLVSLLLNVKPGMQVADICSGAGGKALILADIMKNKGRILSIDIDNKRLINAGLRLKRAGVHNVERRLVKPNWNVRGLEKKFDLVLIDAPCSGIGTWSRSPDSKFNFSPNKLRELVVIQEELLFKGSLIVAPGGKLAYVVCSFLPEEGINQIKKFKKKINLDFTEINLANMWNDTIFLQNAVKYPFQNENKSLTINPAIHQTDGFFISIFQRKK